MDWNYAILDKNGNISSKTFLQLDQRFSEGKNFAKFNDSTDFYNNRAIIKSSETIYTLIDGQGNKLKTFNNIVFPRYFSCGLSLVQIKEGNKI